MNILEELKTESNGTYKELYVLYFNDVKNFITARQGSLQDAEDLFQDTLIILIEKLRREEFLLSASLKTYITAIAKFLWFKKYKTRQREYLVNGELTNEFYSGITGAIDEEKTYWEKIKTAMTKITSHCNRLLHDMFFKNKSARAIKNEYGYSSVHNTQNQKYKCLNQIRAVIESEKKLM